MANRTAVISGGKYSREREIYMVTGIGSLVNVGLFAIKLAAGILGRSSAMIADAVHSLSDFITDIIVVVFVKLSAKPADRTHAYGHGKFETLATVLVALSMTAVGIMILFHAVKEIIDVFKGEMPEVPGVIAFWAAILSILSKEMLFRYTIVKGKKLESTAVVANAWHHRSDAMSSVCTAAGIGGAILLGGNWVVLDPLAAAIVSYFIIKVGVRMLKTSMDELLERALPADTIKEITETIISVPGADQPHHLQTRRIGSDYAIEFDMYVDEKDTMKEACERSDRIETVLKQHFGPKTHVGIHFKIKRTDNR